MDAADKRILAALQRDASLSLAALSAEIGLSATPCWKRVRRLEADGAIRGRVALLDAEKLGLSMTVFVSVRTSRHDESWLAQFAAGVVAIPEVVEFYRLSGEVDYLLKVMCSNIADYDRVYRELIRTAPLADVSSSFAMERIKCTTELPIR